MKKDNNWKEFKDDMFYTLIGVALGMCITVFFILLVLSVSDVAVNFIKSVWGI